MTGDTDSLIVLPLILDGLEKVGQIADDLAAAVAGFTRAAELGIDLKDTDVMEHARRTLALWKAVKPAIDEVVRLARPPRAYLRVAASDGRIPGLYEAAVCGSEGRVIYSVGGGLTAGQIRYISEITGLPVRT